MEAIPKPAGLLRCTLSHRRLTAWRRALPLVLLPGLLAFPAFAASYTVTTASDEFDTPSGANLSLREAVRDAAGLAGAHTVDFAASLSGQTIVLGSEIVLGSNVTIDASGLANRITISGNRSSRVFRFTGASGVLVTLKGLEIRDGSVSTQEGGGGVYKEGNGDLNLTDVTVRNNRAASWGGGIRVLRGTITLLRCSVLENTSAAGGGGLYGNTVGLSITDSTIAHNVSGADGGAILIDGGGWLNGWNMTVAGNRAAGHGGGIANLSTRTTTELTGATIALNLAGVGGGGIWNNTSNTSVKLANVILAGNRAPVVNDVNGASSLGGNLIGDGTGLGGQPLTSDQVGTAAAPIDARLAPLSDYGGPTWTMPPLAGSPAINAGISDGTIPTADQRGFARVGPPDIGAGEAGQALLVNNTNDSGAGSLRAALATAASIPNARILFNLPSSNNRIVLSSGTLPVFAATTILVDASRLVDAAGRPRLEPYPADPNRSREVGGVTLDANRGFKVLLVQQPATFAAHSLTVTRGTEFGQDGGGIDNRGRMTLVATTVTGNQSLFGQGGGIGNAGSLHLIDSTLDNNSADNLGGGLFSRRGTVELVNCTVANNTANSGGGICTLDSVRLTLRHSTVTGNRAKLDPAAGGIQSAGSLHLDNSMVAGNEAANSPDLITGSSTTRRGANLIGINAGAETAFPAGTPNANGDFAGTAAAPLAPFLGPLADHGGRTPTVPLLAGSPAIDQGIAESAIPLTDQRGLPRLLGETLDIGAYESAAADFSPTGLTTFAKLSTPGSNLHFEISSDPDFFATVTTRAGIGVLGFSDAPASAAQFAYPSGVAEDSLGNLFVVDQGNHRIRMINPLGDVTTVAGNGSYGFLDGDGAAAEFAFPTGIAVGPDGNVYVSDTLNHAIRKLVRPTIPGQPWTVETVAGFGTAGFLDGSGAFAMFDHPHGLTLDEDGNVYVADSLNHAIRMIRPEGVVSTYAGTGAAGQADGSRFSARFSAPAAVVLDSEGNFFVADRDNHRVRRIDADGQVTTIAGSGTPGFADGSGPAATLNTPIGVAVDLAGDVLVSEKGNHAIRKLIHPPSAGGAWEVKRVAGNGTAGFREGNTSAAGAQFNSPAGITVSSTGVILVADLLNHRVRNLAGPLHLVASPARQDPDGQMFAAQLDVALLGLLPQTTYYFRLVAGGSTPVSSLATFSILPQPAVITKAASDVTPDGATVNARVHPYGAATSVTCDYSTDPGLLGPLQVRSLAQVQSSAAGLGVDASGNIYLAGIGDHRIWRVTSSGGVNLVAGGGNPGFADGNGPFARFDHPADVAVDPDGNLYVADEWNHRIRRITPQGAVSTVAGSGVAGFADATIATNGRLLFPCGVAVDAAGTIYIADRGNHRIRKLVDGSLTTLAGTGTQGFVDGPATSARFANPTGVAVDLYGNVVVADRDNHRIRIVSSLGNVWTLAGTGIEGFLDGEGLSAEFAFPNDVTADQDGNFYVADRGNHRLRLIDTRGTVSTAAGDGIASAFDSPTGAILYPPSAARFTEPVQVACGLTPGAVYVTERGSSRLRLLERGALPSVSLGQVPGTSGETDLAADIPVILLPNTTYFFRARADNGQAAAHGSIRSFTTPQGPRIAILTKEGALLENLDFGSTPIGAPVSRDIAIANLGQWPLEVSRQVLPTGFTAVGGTGTVAPGDSLPFTLTLEASAGGIFSGRVIIDSNDQDSSRFTLPVSGTVLDPPAVATRAATEVQPTSATLHASVDPRGNPTTVWFEYAPDPDLDGVRVSTLAGANPGFAEGTGSSARFNRPSAIAIDALGNAFIADTLNHRIRRITPAGTSSTVAGTGTAGFADGPGASAQFNEPTGLALGSDGTLYVADSKNQRIRAVSPDGKVTTHSGFGSAGFVDGVASAARFNLPTALAIDATDTLFVADFANHRIRRIAPDGSATTLAGNGVAGILDGPASQARFNRPHSVAVGSDGILYLTETGSHRLRRVLVDGTVQTFAGSTNAGFADGVGAEARFSNPVGLAVDRTGHLLVADLGNFRVRRVSSGGTVSTLAGTGGRGTTDGFGDQAGFDSPLALATGTGGQTFVGESDNSVIRRIESTTVLVQAASNLGGTAATGVSVAIAQFAAGTTYYFRALATNGGGTTYGQILQIASSTLSPFELWQIANFGPNANNPLIAGPAANPSGDGIINLVKYAHGLDPKVQTSGAIGLPVVEFSGGTLSLTYTRLRGTTDLSYQYETSLDLVHWNAANLDQAILSSDAATQRVRDSLVIAPGTRVTLLRLLYSLQSVGVPPNQP